MISRRQIAATVLVALSYCQSGFAADLSPRRWKPEEKARAEQLENSPFPSQARVIEGQSALVAATLSPIAIHAGLAKVPLTYRRWPDVHESSWRWFAEGGRSVCPS